MKQHWINTIQSKLSAEGAKWDVENTLKCTRLTVSLPHDPARGGFGLVVMMMTMMMMPISKDHEDHDEGLMVMIPVAVLVIMKMMVQMMTIGCPKKKLLTEFWAKIS